MKACATCPNRWIADLFEELGSHEKAEEIRAAGCNNWKALKYELKDQNTGQPAGEEVREGCMRDHLIGWFNAVTALSAEVAQTAQSHRNIVAEGFTRLTGVVISGDGRSLPPPVRELLNAQLLRREVPLTSEDGVEPGNAGDDENWRDAGAGHANSFDVPEQLDCGSGRKTCDGASQILEGDEGTSTGEDLDTVYAIGTLDETDAL
jgi:hypothetical protein